MKTARCIREREKREEAEIGQRFEGGASNFDKTSREIGSGNEEEEKQELQSIG